MKAAAPVESGFQKTELLIAPVELEGVLLPEVNEALGFWAVASFYARAHH